jgi:hypothetical protein
MQAEMIVSDEVDGRSPVDIVDLAAEAMWREAAGKHCLECWDQLPECQRQWWRNYVATVLPVLKLLGWESGPRSCRLHAVPSIGMSMKA